LVEVFKIQFKTHLNPATSTRTLLIQSTPCLTAENWESIGECYRQRRTNWRCKTDTCWRLYTTKRSRFCAPCSTESSVEMRRHSSRLYRNARIKKLQLVNKHNTQVFSGWLMNKLHV